MLASFKFIIPFRFYSQPNSMELDECFGLDRQCERISQRYSNWFIVTYKKNRINTDLVKLNSMKSPAALVLLIEPKIGCFYKPKWPLSPVGVTIALLRPNKQLPSLDCTSNRHTTDISNDFIYLHAEFKVEHRPMYQHRNSKRKMRTRDWNND